VTVYGAYGHTGRFIVAELVDRGYVPILSGRDPRKLKDLAATFPKLEGRPAVVTDPNSLDAALAGSSVVVNGAGPFAVTAGPVIEAALRAGIPYVDVAAEIEANVDTFADDADRARAAGVAVVPAMAFYGGLGDLMVTAAMSDWTEADEAHIAYGLSSWHPTAGTREAGAVSHRRRNGRRVRYTGGRLEYHGDPPQTVDWPFPSPMGVTSVVADFTMADVVTIPSHLGIPEVRTYMASAAAADISNPDSPTPHAVDERGRSDQTFVVDVVVRSDGDQRRLTASGQDIYAVTAPLVAEAVDRLMAGQTKTVGVAAPGAIFDAADFLRSLAPDVTVSLSPTGSRGPSQLAT
jgi:short subunit dehydrogenase-like uncharacterized protein